MADISKEELIEVFEVVMNRGRTIDNETHNHHHRYVDIQIKKYEKRQQMWEKFKLSLVGTIATALVGWLIWFGTTIWNLFDHTGGNHP